MIEASAPGKLYIAGEYAVVETGHPAILVALDHFITVQLEETNDQGTIRSTKYGMSIPWTRKNGQLFIDERENPFTYIIKAINITEKYLKELGKEPVLFNLEVQSELDNNDGKKYGLGSSGAVTVATIKALFLFYKVKYTPEIVYKLASLAHLSMQSNGSFGDLAASSYGGWLAYSRFDQDWVIAESKKLPLKELIKIKWPNLRIKPLSPPDDLSLLIGWTGTPASTTQLVDLVKEEKSEMNGFYLNFLKNSKECVEQIISAFLEKDLHAIEQGIQKNRLLLKQLSEKSGVVIETEPLSKLREIAENFGGTAKSSGAGGGDCGIVIINKKSNTTPLLDKWKKEGITPLQLKVYVDPENMRFGVD